VKEIAVFAINKAMEKYDFQLIHLEFVENHFHILIKTTATGESISRIMQYIKARIAERYNRKTGRIGAFWNDRFKSKIVEDAPDPKTYLLHLLWYIGYNPVRKGTIRDPRESVYGTIRSYLDPGFIPKVKITLHEFFIDLGNTFEERVSRFIEYEDRYRTYLQLRYFLN
jgi:REP element-mobilizing transposase RayT